MESTTALADAERKRPEAGGGEEEAPPQTGAGQGVRLWFLFFQINCKAQYIEPKAEYFNLNSKHSGKGNRNLR